MKKLDKFYKAFEEIQRDIEIYVPTDAASAEIFEIDNEEERQLFDERYYTVAARLQPVIDTAQEAQVQRFQMAAAGQNAPSTQQDQPARESQPKLPELKLPEFSEKYTDWMIFKNTFEAAIHDNLNLTSIRKLQYLMGQLKGEANQVISDFKLSNENYPIV